MLGVVVLVLAQATASGAAAEASAGTPRPACTEGSARRANVWERAKSPELRRYCDLLASASSKLVGATPMATAALDAAREAGAVWPGQAAPRVLEGRALAILGRSAEALVAFEDARARDVRAFDEPLALLAFARVLAATGRDVDASRAYRALLPRASTSFGSSGPVGPSSADRTEIATEAGLEAMRLGPAAIEEAAADLREALRGAQGETEKFVVLALALALDRSSRGAEARTLLTERSRGEPRAVVAAWARRSPFALPAAEAAALAALALEGSDPAGARDGWEDSLKTAPDGAWAPYARERVASLRAGPSRRPR